MRGGPSVDSTAPYLSPGENRSETLTRKIEEEASGLVDFDLMAEDQKSDWWSTSKAGEYSLLLWEESLI